MYRHVVKRWGSQYNILQRIPRMHRHGVVQDYYVHYVTSEASLTSPRRQLSDDDDDSDCSCESDVCWHVHARQQPPPAYAELRLTSAEQTYFVFVEAGVRDRGCNASLRRALQQAPVTVLQRAPCKQQLHVGVLLYMYMCYLCGVCSFEVAAGTATVHVGVTAGAQ